MHKPKHEGQKDTHVDPGDKDNSEQTMHGQNEPKHARLVGEAKREVR